MILSIIRYLSISIKLQWGVQSKMYNSFANIFICKLLSLMLSDLGSRSNHLPSIPSSDQKSPYLLQFKVFEQRLKRQQRKGKPTKHGSKSKAAKSQLQEDYLELTRNILSKKQNLNLFEDMPCQTEPSISNSGFSEQLAAKTRMLFEQKVTNKRGVPHYRPHKDEVMSEYKENMSYKSRVGSESNSYLLKEEKAKNNNISFIGYKKNKKPILELGFKKVLGFI